MTLRTYKFSFIRENLYVLFITYFISQLLISNNHKLFDDDMTIFMSDSTHTHNVGNNYTVFTFVEVSVELDCC